MSSVRRHQETARLLLAAHISRHGLSGAADSTIRDQWELAFKYARIGDDVAREIAQGKGEELESWPSGPEPDAVPGSETTLPLP